MDPSSYSFLSQWENFKTWLASLFGPYEKSLIFPIGGWGTEIAILQQANHGSHRKASTVMEKISTSLAVVATCRHLELDKAQEK